MNEAEFLYSPELERVALEKAARLSKLIVSRNKNTEHPPYDNLITWTQVYKKLEEILHTLIPIGASCSLISGVEMHDNVLTIHYMNVNHFAIRPTRVFVICDGSYLYRDKEDYLKDWKKTMNVFCAREKKLEEKQRREFRYQHYLELKEEFDHESM
jgi:hypothetical protein